MPWLCVLFFCSGFPALIYQIVWQRALFAIYGINIESVTIVVSAFMLGPWHWQLSRRSVSKRTESFAGGVWRIELPSAFRRLFASTVSRGRSHSASAPS